MTKNFKRSEFECKSGAKMPAHVSQNVQILAENLQVVRDIIGQRMDINSGYRSPAHNKKVGGAPNSTHLQGMAADVRAEKMTPQELFDLMDKLMREGKIRKGGLKAYPTFVHYDIAGTMRRW
jgi:uncharacterized protein YcbK (DUF882 family)